MEIAESRQAGVVVVAPAGRIDSATCTPFEALLLRLLAGGERRFVVDFAEVDYLSSAGLRVMLTLAKRLREARGALTLSGLRPPVYEVFDLAGFLPLFAIESSRDAAVARTAPP